MEDLIVTYSAHGEAPYLHVSYKEKAIVLKGQVVTYMDDIVESHFKPLENWLTYFFEKAEQKDLRIEIKLGWFPTFFIKLLLELFKNLETYKLKHKAKIKIVWFYQILDTDEYDEHVYDVGNDLKQEINLDFTLVPGHYYDEL